MTRDLVDQRVLHAAGGACVVPRAGAALHNDELIAWSRSRTTIHKVRVDALATSGPAWPPHPMQLFLGKAVATN